jgi:hypothetical protein
MNLNKKQQIMTAIYVESQKNNPHTQEVTSDVLAIEQAKFEAGVDALLNEKLISIHAISNNPPNSLSSRETEITCEGKSYIENKLEINDWWDPLKKVEKAKKQAVAFGLISLVNFINRVLADMQVNTSGQN